VRLASSKLSTQLVELSTGAGNPLPPKADIDRRQLTRDAMVLGPGNVTGQHSMERAVATGTVKWFNPTKGYGFIQPQSGGKDVFVHISALERAGLSTLNEGATVDYEIVSDRGKESAGNLKVRK
jgi:cold shock protein